MDFIQELQWRGMLHNISHLAEVKLKEGKKTGYVGIDPSAPSLHIGNLCTLIMLRYFQLSGHCPIVVAGGATGLIGDPSGKTEERKLLSVENVNHNLKCISKQLNKIFPANEDKEKLFILNNYDWFKGINILDFLRDTGKHFTLNYMSAKESVKNRMEEGISYLEFSYQLLQAYDFYWLYKNHNCEFQMGGSDQWGNITSGIELIRRKTAKEVFAITCPLLTKSDGAKFGKTETGNIWLDPAMTSPYKLYQFLLNQSDEDSQKLLKIFHTGTQEEIESIISKNEKDRSKRFVQKEIAQNLCVAIHDEESMKIAVKASGILFGSAPVKDFESLNDKMISEIFEGIPSFVFNKTELLNQNIGIIDFLSIKTTILPSRAEAKRLINSGGIYINKEKITTDTYKVTRDLLICNKYILIQKGKKNYFIVEFRE